MVVSTLSLPFMLTVDPGYSDTKVIARFNPHCPELLLMSPQVIELTRADLDRYLSLRMMTPAPENEAWVEFNGRIFAVGFFAIKAFNAKLVLEDLKYELAIAKVLAAVGVMAKRQELPASADIALAIPLPYAEWNSRHQLEQELGKALAQFSFCDQPLSMSLRAFICVPEGGGHAQVRCERLGVMFNHMKVTTVMIGFRDLSMVSFERGVHQGVTDRLGSHHLIELVQQRTAGQYSQQRERKLLEAIHRAGKTIKPKDFKSLLLSRSSYYQQQELDALITAIRLARVEYWHRVERLLLNHIPADVDEVIVGGGTAEYLRSELQGFFAQQFPDAHLSWSAELVEDVAVALNLSSDVALCSRLTDAFGLSRFLLQTIHELSLRSS
jgi:hypothetical protein